MLFILRLIKRLASLGLVLVAVASVLAATAITTIPQVATIVTANEGTADELSFNELGQRSSMYASDGTFLTFLVEEQNREPVTLDEIPQPVIDAILAVEDAEFYEHNGVNFRAVFRALVENINAGGIEQGGSTITQQLIKQSVLADSSQNIDRKSTEAFYALRLERQFTKDEILERYLNTVYFGAGAYGVQAAAETYWGYEDVSELGWDEAAMLAGLIRLPGRYDPTINAVAARNRRATVADVLVAGGHITEERAEEIKRSALPAERQEPFDTKPTDYFIEEALQELLSNPAIPIGEVGPERFRNVYFGGYEIYTTFDLAAQDAALRAREDLLPEDDRGFTIAIAAVDTHTSAVRAMVGGPEFAREQFNLTTDGLRQPGSSMKTFVLAALFEAGYTPRDTVRGDSPCKFDNPGANPPFYEVKGGGGGVQSLASVTRSSNNCAFVRLGQVVGNEEVIEVSQRLGLTSFTGGPADAVLSLPLGAKEVHPLEMATAYAAMGNDGIFNEAWYIERIVDRDGEVIYEHRSNGRRAISTQSARMISETLASNVRSGTGRAASLASIGHEAGGKTGTTQNYEDAWFVGYTDHLATAVWMGHPDEKVPMRGVPGWGNMFGGKVPAAVWGQFNLEYHADLEPVDFPEPDSYSGGRYLKVDSEIDFCNASDRGSSVQNTELVDSDGDGAKDCFRIVTTLLLDEDGNPIPVDEDGNPITTIAPPTTVAPPVTEAPPATEAPPVTEAPPATEAPVTTVPAPPPSESQPPASG